MAAADDVRTIGTKFGDRVVGSHEFRGEHTVEIRLEALKELLGHAKDELGYDFLIDISSLDHFGEEPRFEVVYELADVEDSKHLRVRAKVSEDEEVPSATGIWPAADWHEREIFDMMGVRFSGHPDLRRILMWEGYPFYPLRKDFPLGGKPSEMPDTAFTGVAPLEGGPFVTSPGEGDTVSREPRARRFEG